MNIPLIAPYITLLKSNKHYRWLWLSQVISLTGDWFNLIAITTLVVKMSGSGIAMSSLFLARLLPPFFLGPIVGVVADRFDRRKILITSDILRVFVVLGFLLVKDASQLWMLYALTILQLSISAFFEPTRAALVPSLVKRENLVTANALDGTTWSTMLALGAALGGVVAVLFGISAAFIADALTFALSAWFVSRITVPAKVKETKIPQSSLGNYIDGLRYLWHQPHILALALVKGAMALSFGVADVIQVMFAENIFRIGENSSATLGIIYAAIGIGTGFAPLLARRFARENGNAMCWAIAASFALNAIGFLGVAWAPTLSIFLVMTIIRSGGSGIGWVYSSALLQMAVPDKFRGRVFAFDLATYTLAAALSTYWAGFAFDHLSFSPRNIAMMAALMGVITLVIWMSYHYFQRRSNYASSSSN